MKSVRVNLNSHDSADVEHVPLVTRVHSGLQFLFNLHGLGSNMDCLFLYCKQHNTVISKCLYTTREQAAIGMIAVTPSHSIVSYGSAICDLCPFSQVHKMNTR
jgi:hypothetical protein